MIFNEDSPVYAWFMNTRNSRNRSQLFLAWVYFYVHILQYHAVKQAYLDNQIYWEPELFRVAGETRIFTSRILPDWFQNDINKRTQFWGYVQFFCWYILKNPVFFVIRGGPSTGNGFGLCVHKATDHKAIMAELYGLIEPLSAEEFVLLKDTFKYKSFVTVDKEQTFILFGALSLVNNDNHSAFEYIDRDYRTDQPMFVKINREVVSEYVLQPVTTVKFHRCIKLLCMENVLLTSGEQIFAYYRDANFIDLTHNTSEEDSNGESDNEFTPLTKVVNATPAVNGAKCSADLPALPVLMVEVKCEVPSVAHVTGSSSNSSNSSSSSNSGSNIASSAVPQTLVVDSGFLFKQLPVEEYHQKTSAAAAASSNRARKASVRKSNASKFTKKLVTYAPRKSAPTVSKRHDTPAPTFLRHRKYLPPMCNYSAFTPVKIEPESAGTSAVRPVEASHSGCSSLPPAVQRPWPTVRYERKCVADTHDDETCMEYTPVKEEADCAPATTTLSRPVKPAPAASAATLSPSIADLWHVCDQSFSSEDENTEGRAETSTDDSEENHSVYDPEEESQDV